MLQLHPSLSFSLSLLTLLSHTCPDFATHTHPSFFTGRHIQTHRLSQTRSHSHRLVNFATIKKTALVLFGTAKKVSYLKISLLPQSLDNTPNPDDGSQQKSERRQVSFTFDSYSGTHTGDRFQIDQTCANSSPCVKMVELHATHHCTTISPS